MQNGYSKLIAAVPRVGKAQRLVAKQRLRIAQLTAAGYSTEHAERTLAAFLNALKSFEDHARLLLKETARETKPPEE
jgi:hypothetical protein